MIASQLNLDSEEDAGKKKKKKKERSHSPDVSPSICSPKVFQNKIRLR